MALPSDIDQRVQTQLQAGYSLSDIQNTIKQKYGVDYQPQPIQQKPSGVMGVLGGIKKGIENASAFERDSLLGVAKGVASTISGASQLGQKYLLNPVTKLVDPNNASGMANNTTALPSQMTDATNTAQRIGKFGEQAAEFLIPGGAGEEAANAATKIGKVGDYLSNAPKIIQGGAKLLSRGVADAALFGGQTAMQTGNIDSNAGNAALIGLASPVAGKVLEGTTRAVGEIAKSISSKLSGVPTAAIEYAIQKPAIVQSTVKKAVADGENGGIQKIYQDVISSLDDLEKSRSDAYNAGLKNIEDNTTTTKNGTMYVNRVLSNSEAAATKGYVPGTTIGVPTNLTTNGIKNVFTSTVKDFGATGGKQGGIDFANVAMDDSHISKLNKLQDRIYNWTDTSPTGINRLRQVIDGYRVDGIKLGPSENKFNSIVGSLRTNLANYIGERVPQVADMNKTYALQSKVIDDMKTQLNLASNNPQTAMRKLMNVFNPKSTVYAPLVKELGAKTGKDFMAEVAGQMFSKWTPEGLGAYLSTTLEGGAGMLTFLSHSAPAAATIPAIAAMSSPRIVGAAARTVGDVGNFIERNPALTNSIKRVIPASAVQSIRQ